MTAAWPACLEVRSNSVAIVGWDEGNAGQIHSWLESATGFRIACFVHDGEQFLDPDQTVVMRGRETKMFSFPQGSAFKGLPLIASLSWPDVLKAAGIRRVLVSTSDEADRSASLNKGRSAGLECIQAIHPTVTIMPDAVLHENVILHARAFIGYRAELYPGTIVNTGAQIDHHSVLYSCCTIDPGVICAGGVIIDERAHVHPGAIIAKRIRIGRGAIVAAGAVVLRNVNSQSVVFGIPARTRDRRNT